MTQQGRRVDIRNQSDVPALCLIAFSRKVLRSILPVGPYGRFLVKMIWDGLILGGIAFWEKSANSMRDRGAVLLKNYMCLH